MSLVITKSSSRKSSSQTYTIMESIGFHCIHTLFKYYKSFCNPNPLQTPDQTSNKNVQFDVW